MRGDTQEYGCHQVIAKGPRIRNCDDTHDVPFEETVHSDTDGALCDAKIPRDHPVGTPPAFLQVSNNCAIKGVDRERVRTFRPGAHRLGLPLRSMDTVGDRVRGSVTPRTLPESPRVVFQGEVGRGCPGRLDQQLPQVGVPGLGDRAPRTLDWPEESSDGTSPMKEPMVLPVNRSQSPTSPVNANPVNVLPHAVTPIGSDRGDLASQPPSMRSARRTGSGEPSP